MTTVTRTKKKKLIRTIYPVTEINHLQTTISIKTLKNPIWAPLRVRASKYNIVNLNYPGNHSNIHTKILSSKSIQPFRKSPIAQMDTRI